MVAVDVGAGGLRGEAAFYQQTLLDACTRPPRTMLELGSGGGNNASFLKSRFDMVLVDPSPGMLAVSRSLNPVCEHVEGDMRNGPARPPVRLRLRPRCGLLHDDRGGSAGGHRDGVRALRGRAAPRCSVPDHVRENFQASTDHGGHDGTDRSLRYLEWTWDPDPADSTYNRRLRARPARCRRIGITSSWIDTSKDSFRAKSGCSC